MGVVKGKRIEMWCVCVCTVYSVSVCVYSVVRGMTFGADVRHSLTPLTIRVTRSAPCSSTQERRASSTLSSGTLFAAHILRSCLESSRVVSSSSGEATGGVHEEWPHPVGGEDIACGCCYCCYYRRYFL